MYFEIKLEFFTSTLKLKPLAANIDRKTQVGSDMGPMTGSRNLPVGLQASDTFILCMVGHIVIDTPNSKPMMSACFSAFLPKYPNDRGQTMLIL